MSILFLLIAHRSKVIVNGKAVQWLLHRQFSKIKLGKRVETLQRDWSLIFQKLTECEPSLLILDDLDLLAGSSDNNQDDNINGEAWYYKRYAYHLGIYLLLYNTIVRFIG